MFWKHSNLKEQRQAGDHLVWFMVLAAEAEEDRRKICDKRHSSSCMFLFRHLFSYNCIICRHLLVVYPSVALLVFVFFMED